MIKLDAFGDSLCRWDEMTRSNPTMAAQGTGHLYHEALPLVCSRLGNNNQKNPHIGTSQTCVTLEIYR